MCVITFLLFFLPSQAQPMMRGGMVWDHDLDKYVVNQTFLIDAGWQTLFIPDNNNLHYVTFRATMDYAGMSIHANASFGKNFIQVSPIGLLPMMRNPFLQVLNNLSDDEWQARLFWSLLGFSSIDAPITLGDRFDLTIGIDAFKMTWVKGKTAELLTMPSDDKYHMFPGSDIYAGLSFYLTANIYVQPFYELNYFWGKRFYHSFSARIGWFFD